MSPSFHSLPGRIDMAGIPVQYQSRGQKKSARL